MNPNHYEDYENTIAYLTSLGYTKKEALKALTNARGDPNAAKKRLEKLHSEEYQKIKNKKREIRKIKTATYEKLRLHNISCDAELKIGKNATPFAVHKAMLAAVSKFFEKLFYPDAGSGEILSTSFLEDLVEEDFRLFLEFCYTGQILNLTEFSILKLYKFAKIALIDDLIPHLVSHFENIVTIDNVIMLFQETSDPIYERLRTIVCTRFIEFAPNLLLRKNILNIVSIDTAIDILKLKVEKIPEKIILERVFEYVNENTDSWLPIKQKREMNKELIKIVQLDKLGSEGIEEAWGSGLFRKKDLLKAIFETTQFKEIFRDKYH